MHIAQVPKPVCLCTSCEVGDAVVESWGNRVSRSRSW